MKLEQGQPFDRYYSFLRVLLSPTEQGTLLNDRLNPNLVTIYITFEQFGYADRQSVLFYFLVSLDMR
jgi:hypothetical protein